MASRSGWSISDDLADGLVNLYAEAEQRILADIARAAKHGLAPNARTEARATAINKLRATVQNVVGKLANDTDGLVHSTLLQAHLSGSNAALDEIARVGGLSESELFAIRQAVPGADAVAALSAHLSGQLRGTHLRMVRWLEDTAIPTLTPTPEQVADLELSTFFQRDVAEASSKALLGLKTSRTAQAEAWDKLTARGIDGFVDRSGRRWQLSSYVEMATRTTIAQTATQAQLDRQAAAGFDLVSVDDAAGECVRCRPWEGKVLTQSGAAGARTVEAVDPASGKIVKVRIAGSVREAIAKGLMHPNCRHAFSAFVPGHSVVLHHTEDPEGEANRIKLRKLERNVRKAKLQQATALTPELEAKHAAKVKDLQKQIRDHVDETGITRKRNREQINLALGSTRS